MPLLYIYSILDVAALIEGTVDALVAGAVVGWFQGRMEFGPRALGCRSILADPRSTDVHQRLNRSVKQRESFRPFASAVLAGHACDWFDLPSGSRSPYMLLTAPVTASRCLQVSDADGARTGLDRFAVLRSVIPAVTHVDCSVRVQTVGREAEPRFRTLLEAFFRRTGCSVLLNTSFNVAGEPLVCTPRDALRTFRAARLDVLALGDCLVRSSSGMEPRSVGGSSPSRCMFA